MRYPIPEVGKESRTRLLSTTSAPTVVGSACIPAAFARHNMVSLLNLENTEFGEALCTGTYPACCAARIASCSFFGRMNLDILGFQTFGVRLKVPVIRIAIHGCAWGHPCCGNTIISMDYSSCGDLHAPKFPQSTHQDLPEKRPTTLSQLWIAAGLYRNSSNFKGA